jgi:hypothetical protein
MSGLELPEGCYQPCREEDDPTCPEGTSCQPADIDPCVCNEGEVCCDACSSIILICLPGGPGEGNYLLPSLADSCEGAITGQEILDAVDERYAADFQYTDSATPPTSLDVGLRFTGGTLICHPAIGAQPAFLEVEVDFTATSGDGAFTETGIARLSAFMAGTTIDFAARFDAASLAGSYAPTLRDIEDHVVTFSGDAIGSTSSGMIFEGGTGPTGSQSIQVGTWLTR